ncbi:hypothetical protein G3I59_46455 [Amycolatopsis rubida]|uniref:Uncharacterized protein n=1 Tax=Amycolatopsis rubida TaxID=112413 RepID=A0ABX0CCR6_9PSEU|nr:MULTISPECIES: hypothetical protein [Amycolatopsis]MYW97860.1 hypothetical protein [Amycolatopsis rubida]NEC62846.1 hypothetical protein [Amycolatopsis rubida]OAP24014.1 hypothetical protein A4R44_05169 [Amycolatopsis sp. M39]
MGHTASPGYAYGQLERAVRTAMSAKDRATRRRAAAKAGRWQDVLTGMATSSLRIGSRTPVADTPAWVTLEVVHGGFATGRFLAEVALSPAEAALCAEGPGTTERERLNLWYLTDAGLAALRAMLATESYRIEVPEDAALPTVAWLLDHGHAEAALDLIAELRPHLHRLRLAPLPGAAPRPAGALVRLSTVGEVRESLRSASTPPAITAMLETLTVWHPLFDRLVALWCDTVEGELPRLDGTGVAGGWPCRTWPADWQQRRAEWLADYARARFRHTASTAHTHPKSNFARLHRALLACEHDSTELTGRDVGWIRRALANTITKHGEPGSEPRAALRALQAAVAARPTHAELAAALAERLDRFPADGGLPAIEPVAEDAPAHLVAKVARALEAPIEELVARNVITSADVLATVLPQITAQLLAANFDNEQLSTLYAQTYAAFRRRRGLLLLDLEHQVRIEELPWVHAIDPLRARRPDATRAARHTLDQTVLLALSAFPQAILPNTLVRELGALAKQAGLPMPLVEEVAADIFMGTFTEKWRTAAELTSRTMAGTLYARYYDLPESWTSEPPPRKFRALANRTADDFAGLCVARAGEARPSWRFRSVAANGTVLEQSQILTTQNLAVLVHTLDLRTRLQAAAPELAAQSLTWAVTRLATRTDHHHTALQAVKNAAYAWRQALFFLSFCDLDTQRATVRHLAEQATRAGLADRFAPAVNGLAHVVEGGRFTPEGRTDSGTGRRFLGWTTGKHWCLPEVRPTSRV